MASAVSSIYEYPISAASAAYAPTNTAEVTAMIDSAVSGKLDASASSSFVTSTADLMPLSASSNYASTSDLSAKLDASAVETSTAGVTAIGGTAIAGGGGGGGVVTATGTATAGDTAEPTTYVTSIDGMALSAANDTVLTAAYRVTSYDPELSASSTSTATGTATGFGVVNQDNAVAFSTGSHVSSVKMNDGNTLRIMASQLGAGTWQTGGKGSQSAPYFWLSFSPADNAFPGPATTGYLSPCQYATGAGIMMSAGYFRGMLKANELFLSREQGLDMSTATNSFTGYYLRAEGHNSRGAHVGLTATRRPGGAYTGDSSECWTSVADFKESGVSFNYTSTGLSGRNNYNASVTTASIRLSAAFPTSSSQESMTLGRHALTFTANDSSESGTGSARTTYTYTGITFEDSASTATMEKSSIGYWNDKLDVSSIELDSASAITGIAGSSIAGGGGTTYSAGQYIQISGDEISVTGINPGDYAQSSSLADYQTTADMSAYATTADLSAKLDESSSSAFITSTADCMPLSASSDFATTGDLSGKLDASASSAFITSTAGLATTGDLENYQTTAGMSAYQLSGNYQTAGDYVSSSELAAYQTTAGMSGYATTADLSAKLDASASSSFITSTAGLVSTGDLSAYLETSAIETSTAGVTGIAGTAIAGGGGGSADWSATAGEPGYIENKPVPKTLVAGAGITITENASSLSVAATNSAYSAGSGLTLSGSTFSVDTGVVATQSDLTGYIPGTSPMIDTETFAGYWNGSAVYQKIVTGVISSNAASTAVDSDTAYAGKQVWIDPSNSYMTYGSTSNLLPLNWYLGSARNGGFSFVGTGRPILYRGIDNSETVCTAYICVKYIK